MPYFSVVALLEVRNPRVPSKQINNQPNTKMKFVTLNSDHQFNFSSPHSVEISNAAKRSFGLSGFVMMPSNPQARKESKSDFCTFPVTP